MITEIGIVAGDIWHYLEKNDSATLAQLQTGLGRPQELILMSLGWLAREGHVNLGDGSTGYRVRLNSPGCK